jgi:hypothetical protein
MTIPEIAAQVRVALGICVSADKDVSPAERSHFTAMQNNSSDEDVISFWLSVSYLDNHRVSMFIVTQKTGHRTPLPIIHGRNGRPISASGWHSWNGIPLHRKTTDGPVAFGRAV